MIDLILNCKMLLESYGIVHVSASNNLELWVPFPILEHFSTLTTAQCELWLFLTTQQKVAYVFSRLTATTASNQLHS